MSHLNFNIRAVQIHARARPFNPRATISINASSAAWTMFAVAAVACATAFIVWFA